MKIIKLSFITAVLVTFVSCSSNDVLIEPYPTSYKSYGLNQSVQSVKVTTYEALSKFGEIVKGDIMKNTDDLYFITFDKNGVASTKNDFNSYGEIQSKHIYTYDDKNRLIEEIVYDGKEKIKSKRLINYRNRTIVDETTNFYRDGQIKYRTENKLKDKFVIEYKLYVNGELQEIGKNKYNSEEIIENTIYDKNGEVLLHSKYNHSETNTNTLIKIGDKRSIQIKYDENGLAIYAQNAYITTTNSWQEIIESSTYYEYEYDEKGNWIKRISYSGPSKQPKDIIERVIVY